MPSSRNPLGMDLKGRKFTLGSFLGEVDHYIAEKNSFLVKFNGVDLMEVDATTVLNLLLQQEHEAKNDEAVSISHEASYDSYISASPAQHNRSISSSHQPLPSTNSPIPNLSWLAMNNIGSNLPLYGIGNQNMNMNYNFNFPLTNSMQMPDQLKLFRNGSFDNMNQNGNINNLPFHNLNMNSPTQPFALNKFTKERFQEGVRRHRSTSQPQPMTEKFIKEANFTMGTLQKPRRRRESLCERRQNKGRNVHSIHENVNVNLNLEINARNNRFMSHAPGVTSSLSEFSNQIHKSFPVEEEAKKSKPKSQSKANNSSSEATKAEIFRVIRNLYQTNEISATSRDLPTYAEIEEKLSSAAFVNASRLSTLRSRFIIRKTLAPVEHLLPVPAEVYIINSFVNLCPCCGSSISLNKLGSHINWFKHLIGSHGRVGEVISNRFDFFETNMDKNSEYLPEFKMDLDELEFASVSVDRKDMAPIEDTEEFCKEHPDLIPFTTKLNLETLLLNNLIKDDVMTNESILLQEIVVFGLIKYKIAPLSQIKKLFPKLDGFQQYMNSVSAEAFKYYIDAGHPDLIYVKEDEPEDEVTDLTMEDLKRRVLEKCKAQKNVDWQVLLFNKALEEDVINNCSILAQEVLVLAFFYFGFITQRTPKKFRIFGKLLDFFGNLYKLSCKCYDIYVGDGPTGAEHTRGKPVNPSKMIMHNYNHYGLSRKSLQRALAKEGKEPKEFPAPPPATFDNLEITNFAPSYQVDDKERFGNAERSRRGSIKRKNDVHGNQTRRRRSSILEYVPVAVNDGVVQSVACADEDSQAGRLTSSPAPTESVM